MSTVVEPVIDINNFINNSKERTASIILEARKIQEVWCDIIWVHMFKPVHVRSVYHAPHQPKQA